jgi:hypothetical protein
MNLELFHHPTSDGKPGNYHWQDKLNGFSKLGACRFLEWSGWYNFGVGQRLLGHYRLFQHFRKSCARFPNDLPVIERYILQYQAWHGVKYFFAKLMGFIYSVFTWNDFSPAVEMAAVNRMLVTDSRDILYGLLLEADTNIDAAFTKAEGLIRQRLKFRPVAPNSLNVAFGFNKFDLSIHQHESVTHHHTYPTQVFNPPVVADGAKGKEKGVYSKRQMLIYFDLLHAAYGVERLKIENRNCHYNIARFLHEATGRPQSAWLDELRSYRNRGLYDCQTDGEIDQLLNTLTDMRESLQGAVFNELVKKLDNKKVELLQKKKRG